ncbi:MAG: heme-copper oxidase subunit III [Herpetosiphonaceae bacterium]|nr:heme-copper oxidase subunit III [Herpetosiphonaceae bacterium]
MATAKQLSNTLHDTTEVVAGGENMKFGMWLFLASEVMFFTSLIGGSLTIRRVSARWPEPGTILNVPLTSLNTFILIVSSVTVVMALASIQENNIRRFRMFLIATLALGLTFLGIQAVEYTKLLGEGLNMRDAITHGGITYPATYGSTFFIQTGFHGMHVFAGAIWLSIVLFKSFRGVYTREDYLGVELFGLYWHFVDLVWIILFTIVYLI